MASLQDFSKKWEGLRERIDSILHGKWDQDMATDSFEALGRTVYELCSFPCAKLPPAPKLVFPPQLVSHRGENALRDELRALCSRPICLLYFYIRHELTEFLQKEVSVRLQAAASHADSDAAGYLEVYVSEAANWKNSVRRLNHIFNRLNREVTSRVFEQNSDTHSHNFPLTTDLVLYRLPAGTPGRMQRDILPMLSATSAHAAREEGSRRDTEGSGSSSQSSLQPRNQRSSMDPSTKLELQKASRTSLVRLIRQRSHSSHDAALPSEKLSGKAQVTGFLEPPLAVLSTIDIMGWWLWKTWIFDEQFEHLQQSIVAYMTSVRDDIYRLPESDDPLSSEEARRSCRTIKSFCISVSELGRLDPTHRDMVVSELVERPLLLGTILDYYLDAIDVPTASTSAEQYLSHTLRVLQVETELGRKSLPRHTRKLVSVVLIHMCVVQHLPWIEAQVLDELRGNRVKSLAVLLELLKYSDRSETDILEESITNIIIQKVSEEGASVLKLLPSKLLYDVITFIETSMRVYTGNLELLLGAHGRVFPDSGGAATTPEGENVGERARLVLCEALVRGCSSFFCRNVLTEKENSTTVVAEMLSKYMHCLLNPQYARLHLFSLRSKCIQLKTTVDNEAVRGIFSTELRADLQDRLDICKILFKMLQDPDVFLRSYKRYLGIRFLSECCDIREETSVSNSLQDWGASNGPAFTAEISHKLIRMFSDMNVSRDIVQPFREHLRYQSHTLSSARKFCVNSLGTIHILTTGTWPLSSLIHGEPSSLESTLRDAIVPRILGEYSFGDDVLLSKSFEEHYCSSHSGRRMQWLYPLFYFTVSVRGLGKPRVSSLTGKAAVPTYELVLSLPQLAVLAQFSQDEIKTYGALKEKSHLTDEYFFDALYTLLHFKILAPTEDSVKIDSDRDRETEIWVADSDSYHFNPAFSASTHKLRIHSFTPNTICTSIHLHRDTYSDTYTGKDGKEHTRQVTVWYPREDLEGEANTSALDVKDMSLDGSIDSFQTPSRRKSLQSRLQTPGSGTSAGKNASSPGGPEIGMNAAASADRKMAMQSTIVRLMKRNKEMSHSSLVNEAIITCHEQYRLEAKVTEVKKAIEQLIENDYLERSEDDSDTYLYVA